MGIEPCPEAMCQTLARGDVSLVRSFFAPSFPLFLWLGSFACQVKKVLAEDEIDESKNSQLPTLRQDSFRGSLERDGFCCPKNCQVSSMRKSEAVERWEKESSFKRAATVQLSRLRSSFFAMVSCFSFLKTCFQSAYPIRKETFRGQS